MGHSKNYAAKAEAGLRNYASLLGLSHAKDRAAIGMVADGISDAQHFTVPDGGLILDDKLRGLEGRSSKLRMPYPVSTIEVAFHGEVGCEPGQVKARKRLIFILDNPDSNEILIFSIYESPTSDELWILIPVGAAVRKDFDPSTAADGNVICSNGVDINDKHSACVSFRMTPLLPTILEGVFAASDSDDAANKMCQSDIADEVRITLEFIEALSCKNVVAVDKKTASETVNSRRMKAGKLPIYGIKTLVIEAPGMGSTSDSAGSCGTHVSPRQHLRRGHIRRLVSGNIWVNSCIVGCPDSGVIAKHYKVKKGGR